MIRGAQRQSGFTLLEVLVALLVLGLLMAGLAQGTQFGVRAWNTQAANVARNSDLDTTERTVRDLLTRAKPPSAPDQPSLQGGAETIRFTAELPEGAPMSLTRLASIAFVVDADHRLLLRWSQQPHAKLLGSPPQVHEDVLLTGVSRLQLSYRDVQGKWATSWALPTLPQLVRLHIVFREGSTRRWPDILVAPMRDSISETGE